MRSPRGDRPGRVQGPPERSPAADRPVALRTARGVGLMAVCVLASGMTNIDATVTSIALPAIGQDLGASLAELQWTVTGYTLTLASFILLGGSAGDRFGRRRVLSVGVAGFAAASAACSLAPTVAVLIGARVLQGVGAALVQPASLAIIETGVREDDRPRAIGTWAAWSGIATAVAPFLGGGLVAVASWRWVYVVNLPVAAVVLALAARHVPRSASADAPGRLDVRGAVLGVLALAGVTYALIGAPAGASTADVAVAATVAVLATAAFLVAEAHHSDPLVPLDLLRNRPLLGANAVTFIVYGAIGGYLLLVVVVLQTVAGFGPVAAGAATLPVTVLVLLFSARSGSWAQRVGPRLPMTLGPCVCAAGVLLALRVDEHAGYAAVVLPAMTVFGAGLAIMVAPLTATALSALPPQRAGLASGLNNAVARAGALLAVAALPGLSGLAGGLGDTPTVVAGFRRACLLSAAALVTGGLVAALTIPRRASAEPTRRYAVPDAHVGCRVAVLTPPPGAPPAGRAT